MKDTPIFMRVHEVGDLPEVLIRLDHIHKVDSIYESDESVTTRIHLCSSEGVLRDLYVEETVKEIHERIVEVLNGYSTMLSDRQYHKEAWIAAYAATESVVKANNAAEDFRRAFRT